MMNAIRAAANRPKVEPMVMTEAPLAGAVRTDEVAGAGAGALADGAPAAVVELPLGNGAGLGIAGPGRLEVAALLIDAMVGAAEDALVVAGVLGVGLAEVVAEVVADVAGEVAEGMGEAMVPDTCEVSTESQGKTWR